MAGNRGFDSLTRFHLRLSMTRVSISVGRLPCSTSLLKYFNEPDTGTARV
jgi:hypothetical protein